MVLAGGQQKYEKKNLPQSHCVHHKPHTDYPEAEAGPNCLGYGMVYPEPIP
jgi:hypothetical protein